MNEQNSKTPAATAEKIDNAEPEAFIDAGNPEPPVLKFLRDELAMTVSEEFCIDEHPPIAIVGVGKLGCAMLEDAGLAMRQPYITIAIGIDREGFRYNTFATRRLVVPREMEAAKAKPGARHFALRQQDAIERLLTGLYTVIFLAGLEEAAETELALLAADILAKRNNPTFAFVVTASESEEGEHHKHDATGLSELRGRVTALLEMPDNALEDSHASFNRAKLLVQQFSRVIASPAPTSGLIGVDISDVTTVLGGGLTLVMGCGIGNGENSATVALEAALNKIVLKIDDLHLAGGVMTLLEVRPSFSLEQYTSMGELLENSFSDDVLIQTSCVIIDDLEADARVTVLARLLPDSQD